MSGSVPVSLFSSTYIVPTTVTDPSTVKPCTKSSRSDCGRTEGSPCLDNLTCTGSQLSCNRETYTCEYGNLGQLGARCRGDESARPKCDSPNVCNSLGVCVPRPCASGDIGCKCHLQNKCKDIGAVCQGGYCVAPSDPKKLRRPCPAWWAEQPERTKDWCDTDGKYSGCETGGRGCPCNTGRCTSGFECKNNRCVVRECPIGNPGCPCNNGTCNNFPDLDLYECSNNKCVPVTALLDEPKPSPPAPTDPNIPTKPTTLIPETPSSGQESGSPTPTPTNRTKSKSTIWIWFTVLVLFFSLIALGSGSYFFLS